MRRFCCSTFPAREKYNVHNTHHKQLLEGDVAAHLHRLAFPLMGGMIARSVFNIADTLYISRLGTSALAALGFTMPLVAAFMGIIFGLSVGTTSALSRTYGEGDVEKIRRLTTDSIVLTTLIISAVSVTGYFFIDHNFRLMGAKEEILPMIHHYMAIWYCGMVFTAIMMNCNACIRATGDTHFPSAMMLAVALINISSIRFLFTAGGPSPRWDWRVRP